jgi:hypothetical protein
VLLLAARKSMVFMSDLAANCVFAYNALIANIPAEMQAAGAAAAVAAVDAAINHLWPQQVQRVPGMIQGSIGKVSGDCRPTLRYNVHVHVKHCTWRQSTSTGQQCMQPR